MTGPPTRCALALVALLSVAALIAGCGGDGGSETTTDPSTERVIPIKDKVLSEFKPGMSEEEVLEVAGVDPVLRQGPTKGSPEGCIYFPLPNEPLADVLQICFDESGLTLVVTALSKSQPAPPEDASPGRAALIGRADSTCQSMYGHLGEITGELQRALGAFSDDMTPSNRSEVARLMDRFIDNLVDTHEQIAAFEAPDDEIETLTAYTDGLSSQIETLREARRAIVADDIDAYEQFGETFTAEGKDARQDARDYGFTVCSASGWS